MTMLMNNADYTQQDFELLRRANGSVHELSSGERTHCFKACEKSSGKIVVLKTISAPPDPSLDPVLMDGARAIAALESPNIAKVEQVTRGEDGVLICREWVEGQSLAERIAADGPLEPRE